LVREQLRRLVFLSSELRPIKQAELRADTAQAALKSDQPGTAASALVVSMPSADTGGRKQLSAARDAQSERWRITLEAPQVVRGYFSQCEEPTGEVA